MPAFQITEIVFDLETDFIGDNGEQITEEQLQKSLQSKVIGEVFIVEDIEYLCDAVSDKYGWCILSLDSQQIPSVEYTIFGLFGGEVNDVYCRGEVVLPGKTSDLAIVRAVKSAIGWSGINCRKEDHGDTIRLYPSGILQCCDIEPVSMEE